MRWQLRPYQHDAIDRVREEVRRGNRSVVLVSPCGSGKTSCACSIIESSVAKGNRAIFLAHRRELIEQASARLDTIGINHGILMANHPRRRPECKVQVASIQTLIRRNKPQADLLIVDECHLAMAKTTYSLIAGYPQAIVIGLTATPWRLDGKGLKALFSAMVVVANPHELVPEYLMEPRVFAPDRPNLKAVHTVRGDYDNAELASVMMQSKLVGNVVEQWVKVAGGVRTIVYAVSIAHSQALRDRFVAAGIRAEHLDGTTPTKEREAILQRLRTHDTQVVVNCEVLTTGFDMPELGCISIARPTQSSVLALQMSGRVLRPYPGKAAPIILDHADVFRKHGYPLDPRTYSLEDIPKKSRKQSDKSPDAVKICKTCFAVAPASAQVCPECGAPFVAETTPPAELDGELSERRTLFSSDAQADPSDRRCRKCGSTNTRPIRKPDRWGPYQTLLICARCGTREFRVSQIKGATKSSKKAEYDRLEAIRAQKGFKRGWVAHTYRKTFGVWPRGMENS